MNGLTVSLDAFEGPLDLLLKLIEKNKIDIYNIPVAELTEGYMESLKDLKNEKMESMSEFIVMASTLLEIKSKMLLPKETNENNEEIDPREELVKRLIEYKKYKNASEILYQLQGEYGQSIFKKEDSNIMEMARKENPVNISDILKGIDADMLYRAFEEVLKRRETRTDKIRSGFNSVTKALYNIEDRITYIKDLLILKGRISFKGIFRETSSRAEIVVTFMAMLELIKEKTIRVKQTGNFNEIMIYRESEGEG